MAIEVISGKVNVSGKIKKEGSRIQLKEDDEKRLVELGFAKIIDPKSDKIEIIDKRNKQDEGKQEGK